MANGRPTTNDNLATMLNNTRLELKSDINSARSELLSNVSDLRRQFETLEAGRLTRLEGKMTDFEIGQIKRDDILKQNQAVLSTKFIIIGAISVAIFNAAMYGLFTRVFKWNYSNQASRNYFMCLSYSSL